MGIPLGGRRRKPKPPRKPRVPKAPKELKPPKEPKAEKDSKRKVSRVRHWPPLPEPETRSGARSLVLAAASRGCARLFSRLVAKKYCRDMAWRKTDNMSTALTIS